METKANFVLIGAFTIAGFLGLVAFLMWFANLSLNRQFAWYDIYFPEVSGLGLSSEVTYAGLTVGKVIDMQLAQGQSGAVRVRVEVAEDTPVRTDSRAAIVFSLRAREAEISQRIASACPRSARTSTGTW